jgi:hypothetical protein
LFDERRSGQPEFMYHMKEFPLNEWEETTDLFSLQIRGRVPESLNLLAGPAPKCSGVPSYRAADVENHFSEGSNICILFGSP